MNELPSKSDFFATGVIPAECHICLDPYDNVRHQAVEISVCGHQFGKECLEKWLRDAHECPKCRTALFINNNSNNNTPRLVAVEIPLISWIVPLTATDLSNAEIDNHAMTLWTHATTMPQEWVHRFLYTLWDLVWANLRPEADHVAGPIATTTDGGNDRVLLLLDDIFMALMRDEDDSQNRFNYEMIRHTGEAGLSEYGARVLRPFTALVKLMTQMSAGMGNSNMLPPRHFHQKRLLEFNAATHFSGELSWDVLSAALTSSDARNDTLLVWYSFLLAYHVMFNAQEAIKNDADRTIDIWSKHWRGSPSPQLRRQVAQLGLFCTRCGTHFYYFNLEVGEIRRRWADAAVEAEA